MTGNPMTTNLNDQIPYEDVVTLTAWMAQHDFTADDIAEAVRKPWARLDWIERAKKGQDPEE
jgi:hypothetical protein